MSYATKFLTKLYCVFQMWTNVRKTRVPVESALTTRAPTPASAAPATRARSPARSAEVRPRWDGGVCAQGGICFGGVQWGLTSLYQEPLTWSH